MDWLDLPEVQGTLESSPVPQFKSINSLALSFLYDPTLTSIHDHWDNHSFAVLAGMVIPLHTKLQAVNFQRCECAFYQRQL